MKKWDSAAESPRFELLTHRDCTMEDFEIAEGEEMSSYGFHPLDATSKDLANVAYQMLCIED